MKHVRISSRLVSSLVDSTLNVLAVVAAMVFVAYGGRYIASLTAADIKLAPGTHLALEGVDWSRNRRTVVIVTQANCPSCELSLGFFRDLFTSASKAKAVGTVFVSPHGAELTAQLLRSLPASRDLIYKQNLDTLGVPGTPAVIIVDSAGVVSQAWVGRLTPAMEDSVFRAAEISRLSRTSRVGEAATAGSIRAADLIAAKGTLTVVDTRPREIFKNGHIAGAISIPLDELEARARHEVPLAHRMILHCDYAPGCDYVVSAANATTECEIAQRHFRDLGVQRVLTVDDSIGDLEVAGVPIARSRS